LSGLASEEVLALDREAASIAGRIYGELERTGQTIGRLDPLIAAIAIHHDLELVTGNEKHFERVVSLGFPLRLGNWRK
jgi:tRNA(fMet)-specific endonuclease VapC